MVNVTTEYKEQISTLAAAYADNKLTLYLGAGVSVDSGIPTWEKLVAAMYFFALTQDHHQRALKYAYRNYLFAIAEWYLQTTREPMDITARKVRASYQARPNEFIRDLRNTLYTSLISGPHDRMGGTNRGETLDFLHTNETLQAVVNLCRSASGVRSVITYNYDNLLEISLGKDRQCKPVWKANQRCPASRLPCYHVHGYIPLQQRVRGSKIREIIFTEEQYHEAANTSYSWSNLVQLQCMGNNIGLCIGLSLTDHNMRRLLDAMARTPIPPKIYAILPKPKPTPVRAADQRKIRKLAAEYLLNFSERARMKNPDSELGEVKDIVQAVELSDTIWQETILHELGVSVLWIDNFGEITTLLDAVRDA